MKKIYNFILTILAISSFSSCEHEWKDELYDHSISFAKNGIVDIRVRYNESDLPVTHNGKWLSPKCSGYNGKYRT